MKTIIIHSPSGIPNKEKYLDDELSKLKNSVITFIEKRDDGDIELSLEDKPCRVKYFAKVKKTKEKAFDISKCVSEKWYTDILKSAVMMEYLEYKDYVVLFFKK